jgi:hypothetical protein
MHILAALPWFVLSFVGLVTVIAIITDAGELFTKGGTRRDLSDAMVRLKAAVADSHRRSTTAAGERGCMRPLIDILTGYEGAIQEDNDECSEESAERLRIAREELMVVLRVARDYESSHSKNPGGPNV